MIGTVACWEETRAPSAADWLEGGGGFHWSWDGSCVWSLTVVSACILAPSDTNSPLTHTPVVPAAENKTLPRSSSMAAGLERNGRMRVKAIFSHAAGDNSTLLSFKEGDLITLLVPEARDGWHYGESEKTKM